MAITNKGKAWELRNSIWMLWAIFSFGFLNYISFFYTAYRVKQRKWFIAGIIYSLILIMNMVVTEIVSKDHWVYDLSMATFLFGWIFSVFHVYKIRAEYLLRLEARITSGQKEKEIQSLKEQIKREYSGIEPFHHANDDSKETLIQTNHEEEMGIIDINTATEEEIARVPGIGALFAKKVVEARDKENGFTSFDHFAQVMSIKPHLIAKIKPHLAFPEKPKLKISERAEGRIVDF
ncbi:helix-hairpin-helix domain-containing protein [Bacillus sp. FJAT-49711]|uniref:ComEA family DNA-binding protein n=1 Tax=Bacillus sp. FJAT-49711 TaxID=2833585 RepID=UPI001BC968B2|nr:helix-hairpin-helix domain-containing protein [Bacillus sp. FJAT-49711]MBS4218456.1 helix-hairpin-helix domain-containing protein [Bacillus sp. FJAT-49711]